MKRKFIITLLILLELIMVNLTYHSFLNRKITNYEDTKVSKKQFAMYINDGNGYTKYEKEKFPNGYALNNTKSYCEDINGNKVENIISSNGNSITITSSKTVYCTLYFDISREITLIADSIDIEGKNATLTNLVKNGGYEQGEENWTLKNMAQITNAEAYSGNNSLLLGENPDFDPESYQEIKKPDINHSYYGRMMFKSSSNFKSRDARYEYWSGDKYIPDVLNMIFANKNLYQVEDWTLLSDIRKMVGDDIADSWLIRNFAGTPNSDSYTDDLMIIDLTESYGNEIPTKEYLDDNLFFFEEKADIKTVKATTGEFKVSVLNGDLECKNGTATIENGVVTVTGNDNNISCILRKEFPISKKEKEITLIADSIDIEGKNATLTNLVKNGGYEQGEENWTLLSPAKIINTEAYSGSNSLLLGKLSELNPYSEQKIKRPDINHSYYGRMMFKSNSNFESADARFEWWVGDSPISHMEFVKKNFQQFENWTLLSSIQEIVEDNNIADGWLIRNFAVKPNSDSYSDDLMIIDLTESYGNEIPTKEYLDNNLFFFEEKANIKTIKAIKGEFNVSIDTGTIECSDGGFGTIKNGKVTITGNSDKISCILRDIKSPLDIINSYPQTLSNSLIGGMYRYQGVAKKEDETEDLKVVDNNYICLGEDCSEYGDDMYRIIGFESNGNIKVIKKIPVNETFQWTTSDSNDVKWPDSGYYHGLNDNNTFLNHFNESVKSKIIKHDWIYGEGIISGNAVSTYKIETGDAEVDRYIKNAAGEIVLEKYKWNKNTDIINNYIGLMYVHDYLYSYKDTITAQDKNLKKSWLDMSNNYSEKTHECFMTRYGLATDGYYKIHYINYDGGIYIGSYHGIVKLRPVFYLTNNLLLSGEGTLTNPYKIIN